MSLATYGRSADHTFAVFNFFWRSKLYQMYRALALSTLLRTSNKCSKNLQLHSVSCVEPRPCSNFHFGMASRMCNVQKPCGRSNLAVICAPLNGESWVTAPFQASLQCQIRACDIPIRLTWEYRETVHGGSNTTMTLIRRKRKAMHYMYRTRFRASRFS